MQKKKSRRKVFGAWIHSVGREKTGKVCETRLAEGEPHSASETILPFSFEVIPSVVPLRQVGWFLFCNGTKDDPKKWKHHLIDAKSVLYTLNKERLGFFVPPNGMIRNNSNDEFIYIKNGPRWHRVSCLKPIEPVIDPADPCTILDSATEPLLKGVLNDYLEAYQCELRDWDTFIARLTVVPPLAFRHLLSTASGSPPVYFDGINEAEFTTQLIEKIQSLVGGPPGIIRIRVCQPLAVVYQRFLPTEEGMYVIETIDWKKLNKEGL